MSIAHIINPVDVRPSSDLFVAQPITFETMRIAQRLASNLVDVQLYATTFEDECQLTPSGFITAPPLSRSVQDFGIPDSRRLPLIQDIIGNLFHSSQSDFFVYSNVDIALVPIFYIAVQSLIERGFDAFTITRRTIESAYAEKDIPILCAQVGKPHPGFDCFVFSRQMVPQLKLGKICIGASGIGKALILNFNSIAENFAVFKNLHLTFHLGDDQVWKSRQYEGAALHNERELQTLLREYDTQSLKKDPLFKPHIRRMQRKVVSVKTEWYRKVVMNVRRRVKKFLSRSTNN